MRKILLFLAAMVLVLTGLVSASPAQAALDCGNPWTTTNPHGTKYYGDYFVNNGMWNINGYTVRQKLSACNYNDWKVTAKMNNQAGDGAVKTYPHVGKTYGSWGRLLSQPKVDNFVTIDSNFDSRTPRQGIWDASYDLWLNDGSIEVMVWNHNLRQTPAGTDRGTVVQDGHTYDVWKSGNDYFAFVPRDNFDSGTVDLKGKVDYLQNRDWVGQNVRLVQIEYGIEFVSTGNVYRTFEVNDFGITAVKN